MITLLGSMWHSGHRGGGAVQTVKQGYWIALWFVQALSTLQLCSVICSDHWMSNNINLLHPSIVITNQWLITQLVITAFLKKKKGWGGALLPTFGEASLFSSHLEHSFSQISLLHLLCRNAWRILGLEAPLCMVEGRRWCGIHTYHITWTKHALKRAKLLET